MEVKQSVKNSSHIIKLQFLDILEPTITTVTISILKPTITTVTIGLSREASLILKTNVLYHGLT